MPESPEVQALVDDVANRLRGRRVTGADVLEFRTVKTRAAPPSALVGHEVAGAVRHGKHVEVTLDDTRLVVSLGRHGWMRWGDGSGHETAGDAPPALAALHFDDGPTLEMTDAGTWVSLGLFVVEEADAVSAIARLGPDPADPAFSRADLEQALGARRKQVKAVLQEQESISGIGNAYSDEILHRAKISPVVHAATLSAEERTRLFDATVDTIRGAIAARRGVSVDGLKAAKVAAMRVHGRAGLACPVCGDEIREFAFASTTAEYCPTCQTAGNLL